MRATTKTILFALTALLLFASMLQKRFNLFSFEDLKGVVVEQPMPELRFKDLRDGSYQQQTEQHLKQSFGFRQPMIRLYNQYLWDFYRDTPVAEEQVLFGKDGWLYQPSTVADYYQTRFRYYASDSAQMATMLSEEAQRLLRLQQILEEQGTHLFVCMAPGKDLICPEHLPDNPDTSYRGEPALSPRFFNEAEFTKIGVNHLNLERFFLQMKDTADFALFPQTGIHWSKYAALHAADTLIRYMEHLGGINMKNIVIGPRVLDNARWSDDDLEQLLNLLRPMPKPKYHYAKATTDGDMTAEKPKIIIIGDSFWWTIADQIPLDELFAQSPYWYYNNTIHYDKLHHSVSEIDMADELCSSDFVVLLYSATTQYRMNDNFSQQALEAFGVEEVALDSMDFVEREIQRTIRNILASPNSMKSIREKAIKHNKTIDKAVYDDAVWIVDHKIKTGKLKWESKPADTIVLDSTAFVEREIQRIMKRLSTDPKSKEAILEKAKKHNKTYEQALHDDAVWVVKRQIEKGSLIVPSTKDTNTKTENHGIQ